jgi:hypothetical protein
MVGTFHRLGRVAGFPMRSAPKESCYYLPLRRAGRRGLHFTYVRRNPETPPAKINHFCHGRGLSGYGFAFEGARCGIREQILGLPLFHA